MSLKDAVIFLAAMIGVYLVLAALGAERLEKAMGETIIILTLGSLLYRPYMFLLKMFRRSIGRK